MKKFLLVVFFIVAIMSISACNKSSNNSLDDSTNNDFLDDYTAEVDVFYKYDEKTPGISEYLSEGTRVLSKEEAIKICNETGLYLSWYDIYRSPSYPYIPDLSFITCFDIYYPQYNLYAVDNNEIYLVGIIAYDTEACIYSYTPYNSEDDSYELYHYDDIDTYIDYLKKNDLYDIYFAVSDYGKSEINNAIELKMKSIYKKDFNISSQYTITALVLSGKYERISLDTYTYTGKVQCTSSNPFDYYDRKQAIFNVNVELRYENNKMIISNFEYEYYR